jgi:hypothetical protein
MSFSSSGGVLVLIMMLGLTLGQQVVLDVHRAVVEGRREEVLQLLARGNEKGLVAPLGGSGMTLLHLAAYKGDHLLCQHLLRSKKAPAVAYVNRFIKEESGSGHILTLLAPPILSG